MPTLMCVPGITDSILNTYTIDLASITKYTDPIKGFAIYSTFLHLLVSKNFNEYIPGVIELIYVHT